MTDAANPPNVNTYDYDALDRLNSAVLPLTSYSYTKWIVAALAAALLTGGCATAAKGKMEDIQTRLRCGMSVAEVERVVEGRLKALEARDSRLTHFYRRGMADLWLVFENDRLRSSQVVAVQGLLGTKEEPVVNHCR